MQLPFPKILTMPIFSGFSAVSHKISALCRFLPILKKERQREKNFYERAEGVEPWKFLVEVSIKND